MFALPKELVELALVMNRIGRTLDRILELLEKFDGEVEALSQTEKLEGLLARSKN